MATTQESEPPSRREPDAGLASDGRNGVSGTEEPVQDPDQHNDAKLNYYKPNPYEQQHPAAYDSGYGFPYGVQQQQADPYHYPQYPRPAGYPGRPAGNAYPPYGMQGARFPTPTLNQLLQPGAPPATGHRFPYGEYQQQQNPAWPHMQQPRGYPPQQHNVQYKAPLAAQGAAHSYPYGPPPNSQPGYAPTPPATSAASAQDGSKENNDSSTAVSASGSSSSSPSPVVSAASAGASAALSPNNTGAGGATAAAAAAASAPSPAPSPASRSMSPALGQGNNTSPSGQADSTGPTRTTQSPMAAQGAYQHPMPPPPHVGMTPYKMGGGPGSPATSMGPYGSQQPQQYPYMPRPPMVPSPYGPNAGSYGPPPPAGATPPANNANSVSPGPPRPPIPPHMGPPPPNPYGSYPPSSVGGTPPGMNQYPQQPSWGPPPNAPHPGAPPGHQGPLPGGKNMPMVGSRPHTPTHYNLKQHIQAKMGYNMAPSPTSGAPPSAQPPLPQQLMGPYPPPNGSAMNNSGLPSPGMGGPPQGHPPSASSPVANVVTTGPDGAPLDDGSQQSTLSNTSAASGDDQSMPSTPRSRKEGGAPGQGPLSSVPPGPGPHHPHTFSHPPTPQSSVASPGAASSTHEDYGDVHSPAPGPNWNIPNRAAPPSPVCNSHTGSDPYKKKSGGPGDAMARLYEFDDNPERKVFVDRLLRFMEEKGSPIAACPTISKNPLDLFRLYHLVRDRGGFLEVTKAKSWKDVASALGIGASSSAAYTLRKHYTKNLLPFECKFDRGGIDPRPLIDQVETSAKKKPVTKGGLSVPSPAGSSNSQDSFPPPMDGYSNYPGYPPQSHMADNLAASNPFDDQYNRGGGVPNSYPPPPPPSVYNNMGVRPNYPNQAPYSSYQNDYPQQPQPGQPYPPYPGPPPQNRSMYGAPYPEPYGHQGPPPPGGGAPPPAGWGAAPGYPPRHPAPPAGTVGPPSASAAAPPPPATTAAASQAPPQQPTTPQPPQQQQSSSAGPSPSASPAPSAPPSFPEQNDQYQKSGLRQLLASSTIAQQLAATPADRTGYPGNQQQPGQPPYQPNMARPNSAAPAPNMPPRGSTPTPTPAGAPPPGPIQQGPYPGYGPPAQPQAGQPPRPGYAWRGAAPYGNQYPPQGSSPSPMQTGTGPWVPPTGAPPAPRPAGTWDSQQRFTSPAAGSAGAPPQTYNGAPQQWGPSMPNARPYPPMARPPYRPDGKPYAMPPVPVKPGYGQPMPGAPQSMGSMYSVKRDVYFPADSVEAIVPVHAKRRRLGKSDVAPVDAWRIFLALKSGLLAESTWAIDVLNILLFDDSTVSYFGLAYLPGLLEVVLEHFRRCLAEIFGILEDMEICYDRVEEYRAKSDPKDSKKADEKDEEGWWLVPKRSRQRSAPTYDLGSVKARDLVGERVKVLDSQSVVALNVKRGEKVGVVNRDNEVFVLDTRKDWDVYDGFDSGVERWQMGGGDTTQHIVTHFQAELGIVPFVRVLEDKRTKTASSEQGTRADEQTPNQTADDSAKVQGSVLDKSIEETVSNIKQERVDSVPSESEPPAADVPKAEPNKTEERRKEFMLQIRDLHGSLKRRRMEDYEDECYVKDESSLTLVTDTQDNLSRRCIALSNILRSLSFVPGNENELAKNATLVVIIGKLLLLYHDHNLRSTNQKNYDREEDVDFFGSDTPATSNQSSQTKPETEWWWDTLLALRENALVLLANVAGQMDLSQYSEEIARPIVDGLLHWAVCPSAQAQDPFLSFGPHSTSLLSPSRLSLEALCKLCVVESNTDLILATPPFSRLEKLVSLLTRYLCRTEDQVLREFAINLLYNFSAADSGMARLIALSNNSMALLVAFVEQAEGNALAIATQHGIQALRENPEAMGTSLDMLRRAAWTLYHVSSHPDSRQLLAKLEQRLLALVMSQIMDQSVAALLAKSLYLCNSDGD